MIEPSGSESSTFEEVRSKRKRKTEMESEGVEGRSQPKRPSFPPLDASAILVIIIYYMCTVLWPFALPAWVETAILYYYKLICQQKLIQIVLC